MSFGRMRPIPCLGKGVTLELMQARRLNGIAHLTGHEPFLLVF